MLGFCAFPSASPRALLSTHLYEFLIHRKENKSNASRAGEVWSGEATRHRVTEETRVDVTIGDEMPNVEKDLIKERPVWLLESTVIDETNQVGIALSSISLSVLRIFYTRAS